MPVNGRRPIKLVEETHRQFVALAISQDRPRRYAFETQNGCVGCARKPRRPWSRLNDAETRGRLRHRRKRRQAGRDARKNRAAGEGFGHRP